MGRAEENGRKEKWEREDEWMVGRLKSEKLKAHSDRAYTVIISVAKGEQTGGNSPSLQPQNTFLTKKNAPHFSIFLPRITLGRLTIQQRPSKRSAPSKINS